MNDVYIHYEARGEVVASAGKAYSAITTEMP
jgi:hypothetical protein